MPTSKFPTEWYKEDGMSIDFGMGIIGGPKDNEASAYLFDLPFDVQGYIQSACDTILNLYGSDYTRNGTLSTEQKKAVMDNLQKYLTPELIIGIGSAESAWTNGVTKPAGITNQTTNFHGIVWFGNTGNNPTGFGGAYLGSGGVVDKMAYINLNESIAASTVAIANGIAESTLKRPKNDADLMYNALYQYGWYTNSGHDEGADSPTSVSSAYKLLMANEFYKQRNGKEYIDGLSIDTINQNKSSASETFEMLPGKKRRRKESQMQLCDIN